MRSVKMGSIYVHFHQICSRTRRTNQDSCKPHHIVDTQECHFDRNIQTLSLSDSLFRRKHPCNSLDHHKHFPSRCNLLHLRIKTHHGSKFHQVGRPMGQLREILTEKKTLFHQGRQVRRQSHLGVCLCIQLRHFRPGNLQSHRTPGWGKRCYRCWHNTVDFLVSNLKHTSTMVSKNGPLEGKMSLLNP